MTTDNCGATRVGILTNIPSPYRVALFNELATNPSISLNVAFNAITEENRHWDVDVRAFRFESTFLKGRSLSFGKRSQLEIHLNPGVWGWVANNNFDVVIIGGWNQPAQLFALMACRVLRIPTIIWSGSLAGDRGIRRKVARPFISRLLTSCQAFIAYGTGAKEYLEQLGAPPDSIHVAYNTVDLKWWATKSQELRHGASTLDGDVSEHGVTFAYVGQLIERKGLDELIRAFAPVNAQFPSTRLIIAGSGKEEAALRAAVGKYGLLRAVEFLGECSINELPNVYLRSDVVVLPSHDEIWGLVINEAMASGRPVIASSDVGASRDLVINDETGWVFEHNVQNDLEITLKTAASLGPASLRELGLNAFKRVNMVASLEAAAASFVSAARMAASTARS